MAQSGRQETKEQSGYETVKQTDEQDHAWQFAGTDINIGVKERDGENDRGGRDNDQEVRQEKNNCNDKMEEGPCFFHWKEKSLW